MSTVQTLPRTLANLDRSGSWLGSAKLSPEQLQLAFVNTINGIVSRYVRPYDSGSINADLFGAKISGVFDDWHIVEGGMKLISNTDGKLIVLGDPDVVYGSALPMISQSDWSVIKSEFQSAGIPWTVGDFWGNVALSSAGGSTGYYIVRFKDVPADPNALGIEFGDANIGESADEFEDLGQFLAYYAIPDELMLKNIVNKGLMYGEPLPGQTDLRPAGSFDRNGESTEGKVPRIRYSNQKGTFHGWVTQQIREGDDPLINHWLSDSDAQEYIWWLNTVQGNFGGAPTGYMIAWVGIRITFIAWFFQLEWMMKIWDKMIKIRKWFRHW